MSDFARVHNTHLRTCMFPVRMTPQSLLLSFGQAISMFVCVGITGMSLLSIMCFAESSFALDRQTVNETTMISETSPKGALSFPAHIPMHISCIAAVALLSLVCHMFPAQGTLNLFHAWTGTSLKLPAEKSLFPHIECLVKRCRGVCSNTCRLVRYQRYAVRLYDKRDNSQGTSPKCYVRPLSVSACFEGTQVPTCC